MQVTLAFAKATRLIGLGVFVLAVTSPTAWGQDSEGEGTEEGEEGAGLGASTAATSETPAAGPVMAAPPAPPPPPPPPAAPPSPFTLAVKGLVTGSIMVQDNPTNGGNGNTTLFGPTDLKTDKWFWGGDVRQSQLKFFITGPELIGAIPMAGFDFDLLGGNQINSIPGAVVPVRDAMGAVIGTAGTPGVTTNAQGDENILPRVRLAYLELKWGGGTDIVRIGQYHNLIVPMIAASLSHIGAPLGYGAGQLGWRAPGITYSHDFKLGDTTTLQAGIQLNRNNWRDNANSCGAGQTTATVDCVPNGVSLGEASALPQVQARLMLIGPPKASPFPMYAPTAWQLHLVGVWDKKDLSGLGADPAAGQNDSRTTMVVEGGFKLSVGPVLLAGNAWVGKNAGSMFGHIFQMQAPSKGDISGFGGWGQLGFSLTPQLALWVFGGMDKPNEDELRNAMGSGYIKNVQIAAMASFVAGPLAFSLEYLRVMSDLGLGVDPATGMPARLTMSAAANQLSFTGALFF